MRSPPSILPSRSEWSNRDLLEEDHRALVVILKADVTRLGAGTARGIALAGSVGGLGLQIAGIEFRNRDAIDRGEDTVRLERDLQGVPLTALRGPGRGLPERVDRAGAAFLTTGVHDLHLEAVVDRIPRVLGPVGDPDVDAGVGARGACLVDDADHAVAEFLAGVPQQAHAVLGAEKAVLNHELARSNVVPAVETVTIEQRPPARGGTRVLRRAGLGLDERREQQCERRGGGAYRDVHHECLALVVNRI